MQRVGITCVFFLPAKIQFCPARALPMLAQSSNISTLAPDFAACVSFATVLARLIFCFSTHPMFKFRAIWRMHQRFCLVFPNSLKNLGFFE